MAVSRGWVEIWSRPGAATFAPVISNPPYTRASFTAEIYGTMRGEMILPAEYDRLDEIIYTDAAAPANNVRTLARVFFASDTGDPVVAGEWFPDSLEKIEGPDNLVRITGPGIASVMQDARVEFYDWDGSAQFTSTFPDWVWGGPNVLFNSDFEDGIGGNDTFEVTINATGGTFTLTAAGQTTVAQDWDETNTNIEFDLQDLSTVNDVTVSGTGTPAIYELYNNASSGTFDITINAVTDTIAYNAAAATFEAALTDVDVTGSGTSGDPWVLTFWGYGNTLEVAVDDSGLTGGTSTLTQTQSPDAYIITFFSPNDIGTFTADGTNLTGATGTAQVTQTGTAEQQTGNWTVSQGADQAIEPRVHGSSTISIVTTPVDTGTYALQIVAGSQLGGAQQVVSVTPGGLYQASLRIRSTSTGPFRFVIRDLYENLIAAYPSGGGGFTVTANTWTTVTIPDVLIPAGVDAVIFRIAYVGTGTQTFYIDNAEFNEGLAETTVGDMTVLLMQDADGTDHPSREVWRNTADTNTWIDYSSFDASTDSNSDAWTDSELALTIKRGTPYDQMLGQFVELGYEWEVIPDGSTPGTWLLNLYNSGGIGQDRTAANTPQIFGEDSIGGQRLYRRHPPGSTTTVEGDGKISGRASSAGALTAYGRRETYEGDLRVNTLADASLKATQTISDYIRRSQPLTLTRRPRLVDPFPMVDYVLGDTVNVSEPPFMDKLGRRLVGLTWAVDADSEEVTEHFGAVSYTGEAALREGVYQLLSKFQPIRDIDPDGGITLGGSTIPWLVAASDSPDAYKNVAGYLCTGSDDQDTINAAITAAEGEVWLAPGTFYCSSVASGGASIDLGFGWSLGTRLVGMGGTFSTYITQNDSGKSSPGPLVRVSQFCKLENVYVETSDCDAVGIESSEGAIQNCTIYVIGSTGSCISGTSGVSGIWDISNNYLDSSSNDPIIEVTGDLYNITNNLVYGGDSQYGIALNDLHDSVISDNRIFNTTRGIHANGSGTFDVSIVGNNVLGDAIGIYLEDAHDVSIVGNAFNFLGQHGIQVVDASDNTIHSNTVTEPGAETTNTYDGIILSGNSDRNSIQGNKIVPTRTGNATRYGVNISASTCDDNVVADNMLVPSGSFGTGSFNDAGTGTITSRDGNGQFT